ncbi:MAG: hypothetical protein WC436_01050 [Candidatus Babeliales bacterium]
MKNIKKYLMATLAILFFFSANFAMGDGLLPTVNEIFPPVKEGSGKILIISGVSTSGKTTIADHLHHLMLNIPEDQEIEETDSCEESDWEHLALDEMKWKGLNINKLTGRNFRKFETAYNKKQGQLSSINYYLCIKAIEKANIGINVICDTVLDEGGDNLNAFVSEIRSKKIQCYSILVYCHINEILERLKKRNEDSDTENHRDAFTNVIVPYSTMYSTSPRSDCSPRGPLGSLTKDNIRSISTSPLVHGCVETYTQEKFQTRLESIFGFLNESEKVYIYPKANYDFYVQNQDPELRNENTAETCAQKIKAFIDTKIGNSTFKPIEEEDISFADQLINGNDSFFEKEDDDEDSNSNDKEELN